MTKKMPTPEEVAEFERRHAQAWREFDRRTFMVWGPIVFVATLAVYGFIALMVS